VTLALPTAECGDAVTVQVVTVEHAVPVRESDWLVQSPREGPKQAGSMFYIYPIR